MSENGNWAVLLQIADILAEEDLLREKEKNELKLLIRKQSLKKAGDAAYGARCNL